MWFLIVYPCWLVFQPDSLPKPLARSPNASLPVDFPTLYFGGTVAITGQWKNLYPQINPDVYEQPNSFRPLLETSLFKPEKTSQMSEFYPLAQVRVPYYLSNWYDVEWLSRYPQPFWQEQLPKIQTSNFNFLHPPPVALVAAPLATASLEAATFIIWPIFSSLAIFCLAFTLSRFYRRLAGRPTVTEGVLLLLSLLFPFADEYTCGNVSPLLSFFIAWAAYAWMTQKEKATGTAMIPLIITKGLSLTWLPLLVLGNKIRWQTMASLAFWAVILNGAVLLAAGWIDGVALYQRFFNDILPHVRTVVGYDYITLLHANYGFYPANFYLALKAGLLALLYFMYWRNARQHPTKEHTLIVATLAGTVAVFIFFSHLAWNHYFPFLLFFPFSAWLLWEYQTSRGAQRHVALAAAILGALSVVTDQHTALFDFTGISVLKEMLRTPLVSIWPDITVWQFFIPNVRAIAIVLILVLAFMRLKSPLATASCVPAKPRLRRYFYTATYGMLFSFYALYGALLMSQANAYLVEGNRYSAAGNCNMATSFYQYAAQLGNNKAQFFIGKAFDEGCGVSQDSAEAIRWYRRAALLNNNDARNALGHAYQTGTGVPQDDGKAYRWYIQAGFNGDDDGWAAAQQMRPGLPGLSSQ